MSVLQVGGQWDIVQDNGFRVTVNLTQSGSTVGGSAHTSTNDSVGLRGSVTATDLDMHIDWKGGARGHYTGTLSHGPFTPPPIGFLKGSTVDDNDRTSHATWQSEGKNFQAG